MHDVVRLVALFGGLGAVGSLLVVGWRYAMMRIRQQERSFDAVAAPDAMEALARIERLEQELADVHERLDFTERVLARGHDVEQAAATRSLR